MKFNFEATGIGSLPFKDPETACRIVFDNFKAMPFWPQLPKRSYREHMYCQFSEGMPGVVIDENKKSIHVDSNKAASGLEAAYQKYLDGDAEYFRMTREYAEGFYEYCGSFKNCAVSSKFAKGHITGPVSFALSVTDENKKSLIYDKDLFDLITKVLIMKARWQIRKLKALGAGVVLFVDEPYLVSIGSSYVNIPLDSVAASLDEIFAAIREEGAVSGVHCCGNTDWSFVLKRGVDIVNFDAYNFMKEFVLYSEDLKSFLKSGGSVAWGIVPSSDAIDKETASTLSGRLSECMKALADKGVDAKSASSILTPSCGLGTLDEKRAQKIIESVNNIKIG